MCRVFSRAEKGILHLSTAGSNFDLLSKIRIQWYSNWLDQVFYSSYLPHGLQLEHRVQSSQTWTNAGYGGYTVWQAD